MKGWHNEPARHSLAARGVRSGYVPPKYRKEGYEVYLNGVYQGFTKDLEEAKVYADQIGGRVVGSKNRRKILYRARGKGVSRNIFGLYSINTLKGEEAHRQILQSIQTGTQEDVVFTADEFRDQGAFDTESRERIADYWNKNHPDDPFDYNLWYG